jgi:hypothetical protein
VAADPERPQRVARLAVNIAMALQVGEPQLSDVEQAAQLFAGPAFAHAADGGEPDLPIVTAAGALALAAHEHYDGTGRPHGLRGDSIPMAGRIIRAAAAFDDLLHRDAVASPIHALAILSGARAREFDPLVLGALRTLHAAK